jgi:carbamoyl-phosphate synthase small subunit
LHHDAVVTPSPLDFPSALLVLEDGTAYEGRAVSPGTRFGEVVFNTSMTGYQEVLTDPSYRGQIVVMTQSHVGNYGVSGLAEESVRPWVEGFVARRFTPRPSGDTASRSGGDLPTYMARHGVPAIDSIDTRSVVRRIRVHGALRGVITSERSDVDALVAELQDFPLMTGRALVDEVTRGEITELSALGADGQPTAARSRIAVYDFGAKENILRMLRERGSEVVVLPARTPASDCLALDVDGILLSNGPGDPEPLGEIVETVRELADSGTPIFGICLGHQLLGLALGARTFKLKFGHHGGNQPVKDLATGTIAITSQNHGFAVDPSTLPAGVTASHVNLNDGTLEGFAVHDRPLWSVQYHPEAAPGPHDAAVLFDRFLERAGC